MDLAALRRLWPLAAVAVLLAFAGLAAAHSTPQLAQIEARPEPTAEAGIDPTRAPEEPPEQSQAPVAEVTEGLPGWVGAAALGLLGLLLAIALGFVVRALVRDRLTGRRKVRTRVVTEPDAADEVVAALDAGLLDLSDADSDPRRAVIACWVRLEQAAAAAGTPRRPGDTPTDLVSRLLAEQHVGADVLSGFAAVYREARYATHTVDERMRADARAALQSLRTDLAGAPA
jgi:hypothetical protein